jgi:hypothetical protein
MVRHASAKPRRVLGANGVRVVEGVAARGEAEVMNNLELNTHLTKAQRTAGRDWTAIQKGCTQYSCAFSGKNASKSA